MAAIFKASLAPLRAHLSDLSLPDVRHPKDVHAHANGGVHVPNFASMGTLFKFGLHCTVSTRTIKRWPNFSLHKEQKVTLAHIIIFQIRMDVYFLSSRKTRPSLFGTPLILPCEDDTTCQDLYQSVWIQVSRLVSPLPPSEVATHNHAQDW